MQLARGSEAIEILRMGLVVCEGEVRTAFAAPAEARAAFAAAVARRVADGFIALPDELVDVEARRVRADARIAAGDVRGEIFALQDAIERRVNVAATTARLTRLLVEHHAAIYGSLAISISRADEENRGGYESAPIAVAWRGGLAHGWRARTGGGLPYEAIARSPLAREIGELHLTEFAPTHGGGYLDPQPEPSDTSLAAQLAMHGTPPHLEVLSIHAPDVWVGDLAQIVTAADELVELDLHLGSSGSLGAFAAPRLARLALESADPMPLLASDVPALRSVKLEYIDARAFLAALVESPLLARLEHLSIRPLPLDSSALAVLVEHAPRFAHLATLELNDNRLGPETVRAARAALPNLRT